MKKTIGMMRNALLAAAVFAVSLTFAATVDVTAPGEYASAGEATDFVVSGGIGGNVTILAADDGCGLLAPMRSRRRRSLRYPARGRY